MIDAVNVHYKDKARATQSALLTAPAPFLVIYTHKDELMIRHLSGLRGLGCARRTSARQTVHFRPFPRAPCTTKLMSTESESAAHEAASPAADPPAWLQRIKSNYCRVCGSPLKLLRPDGEREWRHVCGRWAARLCCARIVCPSPMRGAGGGFGGGCRGEAGLVAELHAPGWD